MGSTGALLRVIRTYVKNHSKSPTQIHKYKYHISLESSSKQYEVLRREKLLVQQQKRECALKNAEELQLGSMVSQPSHQYLMTSHKNTVCTAASTFSYVDNQKLSTRLISHSRYNRQHGSDQMLQSWLSCFRLLWGVSTKP